MELLKNAAKATGLYEPLRTLKHALDPRREPKFREGVRLYRGFVKRGDLCFDIGANAGTITEMLLRVGARVVSVEPQISLLDKLVSKTKRHKSRSTIVTKAVSDHSGTAILHLRRFDQHASLHEDWEGTANGTALVEIVTLNDLIAEYGVPDFIKIDVEGHEPEVLRGLSRPIPLLELEYHRDASGLKRLNECIKLIERFGTIKINATAGEDHQLLFPKWLSSAEFLSSFPDSVGPQMFGDIIVRYG